MARWTIAVLVAGLLQQRLRRLIISDRQQKGFEHVEPHNSIRVTYISCMLRAVYSSLYVMYCIQLTVRYVLYIAHCPLCTVYSSLYVVMYIVHCTLHTVYSSLYVMYCI